MLKQISFLFLIMALGASSMAANILGFNATQSGNTIKLIPGTYGNIWMSAPAVTGTRTIIDGAGSTINGTINLPDVLQDVDFINFNFAGVPNECFRWSPAAGNEKAGVQFKNSSFKNSTANKCGAFILLGTYSDITQGLSFSQNIEFSGLIINNNLANQVFFLSKSYGLKIHDNVIIGTGSPAVDAAFSHDGIYFFKWSDGECYNDIVRGHAGNAWRIFPAGMGKARGALNIHDNYVEGARKHSAIETNGNYSPAGYAADIYVKNNTFGDLPAGNYHSAGISVYPEPSGSKVFFENNVVFNAESGIIFTDTGTKPDSNVNNWYYATADAAGVDLPTGKLLPTSPQYGKAGAWVAVPVPVVKTVKSVDTQITATGLIVVTITFSDGSVQVIQ